MFYLTRCFIISGFLNFVTGFWRMSSRKKYLLEKYLTVVLWWHRAWTQFHHHQHLQEYQQCSWLQSASSRDYNLVNSFSLVDIQWILAPDWWKIIWSFSRCIKGHLSVGVVKIVWWKIRKFIQCNQHLVNNDNRKHCSSSVF